MRILFVAMQNSIHTARWINQITDQGWTLQLAPATTFPLHDALQHSGIIYHGPTSRRILGLRNTVAGLLAKWPTAVGQGMAQRLAGELRSRTSPHKLERIIRATKPDLIHSLEIQNAGYLVLATKERMGSRLPPWLVSNWGSDVYLYHRLREHKDKVREVLATCDYFHSECARDVALAKTLGLAGEAMPIIPAAGGLDLEMAEHLRQPGPVSQRKTILLKGYQHASGRALVALRAIELCADLIRARGYRILIQLAMPDVQVAAELLAGATGLPIEIAALSSHQESLRRQGSARVHIGLSISDGVSNSCLEAMAMGAFPIQSYTACVDEWFSDGEGGLLVPPEEPQAVAAALRRALTEDDLVDRASESNSQVVRRRLAYGVVKHEVVEMYKYIHAKMGIRKNGER